MKSFFKNFLLVLACLGLVIVPVRATIGALGTTVGGISSTAGFFPAGHWIPAQQPMVQIFPQPDGVTSASARTHQAYWDNVNDIPYDEYLSVAFGAYPYVFTLLQGPPGMTIEQTYYNTFQNIQYGRILWHPQGNISSNWSGEVEVEVTDQQHNTTFLSWGLWTVGQYTTSGFSGTATTASSDTLTINSTVSGTVIPGMVVAGACIPPGDYVMYSLSGSSWELATATTCSTGPESVTGSYAQGAVFASATGSGSSCTYSTPCLLSSAFGSTYSASSFPGAICYVFGGSYTGSTNLPAYTDTDTGLNGFETNSSRKPNALIGIPGQTVTLDATAGDVSGYQSLIQVYHAADWYAENLTPNGYNNNDINRLIFLGAPLRVTFDQIHWTNSGWGGPGAIPPSSNMSMFVSQASQNPYQDLAITYSSETNRQTGAGGNNYGFMDLYSYNNVLVQGNIENSPSANLSALFLAKSDPTNVEIRENYADVGGSNDGFAFGQAQNSGIHDDDSDYNLGINIGSIQIADGSVFTYGNMAVYRNTLVAGAGAGIITTQTTYNLQGPGGPGVINAVSTTGGSLSPGTSYTCGITSLGATGESQTKIGSNGSTSAGQPAGNSNQVALTVASGNSAIGLSWLAELGSTGYNGYCEVTGSGIWTEYSLGNVTSWTYTGAAGTSASPPAASTAISAARFSYYANAFSTTYNTPVPPPTGATIQTTGSGIPNNLADPNTPCVAPATTCLIQSNGQLNPDYVPGSLPPYSSVNGQVGYQIQ